MTQTNVHNNELLIVITQGDCLVESDKIASGSVDLILTDLPYGNMKGAQLDGWDDGETDWDNAIEPVDIFAVANRVLRRNGKLVLFSQEPYSSRLINDAITNIPFGYRMIWEKDHFANALLANKAPVSYYEEVLVLSKEHDTGGEHPLREYFARVHGYIGTTKKAIIDAVGQRADHTFRTNSTQFALCSSQTYSALIEAFSIDGMTGFKGYEELRRIDKSFDSVFNLWEGGKYKSNILRYKKDYDGHHPTQKPVLLLEDSIKTFSNSGDHIVDLTMGSGSTGVAAVNTGRRFTGIEMDEGYFNVARQRISDALQTE